MRTVQEHDRGIRAVLVVEREVARAIARQPRVVGVGDLGRLGGRQRSAEVVARRHRAAITAGARRVPDLDGEALDLERPHADRPRTVLREITRVREQLRRTAGSAERDAWRYVAGPRFVRGRPPSARGQRENDDGRDEPDECDRDG